MLALNIRHAHVKVLSAFVTQMIPSNDKPGAALRVIRGRFVSLHRANPVYISVAPGLTTEMIVTRPCKVATRNQCLACAALLFVLCSPFSLAQKTKKDAVQKPDARAKEAGVEAKKSKQDAAEAPKVEEPKPKHTHEFYVGVASGGVWKTINSGTTWTPVFDGEGSYSIGWVTLDPNDPTVVWVGTGESNSQRSVGYGDGIYRSDDGGKSWKNMGLKKSEHIGRITIDPRDSKVVYAAAEGPLWGPGGDRGLYKSTNGGKTWKAAMTVSENTGFVDVALDPSDPDIVYAAAYQRRRHVFTLIDGGPESAIYKSTDAGATWNKLKSGLPTVDMGRMGISVSTADPNVVS